MGSANHHVWSTSVVCSLQSEFFHDQKTRLSAAFSSPQLEWVDTSSEEEEYWDSFNGERSHSPQSGFQGASEDCQAPSDRQSRSGADVD